MPRILCDQRIRCPGTDFPITNFSSEATDGFEYLGMAFPFWDFPINKWYDSHFCSYFFCLSPTSQEDADLCAERNAQVYCPPTPPNGDPDIPSDPLFGNTAQAATSTCPDGTVFTYVVAANTFVADSQILADFRAGVYAIKAANRSKVCLSNINGICCDLDEFSQPIHASGLFGPFTFALVAGSLPAGFTMTQTDDNTVVIAGIPTAGTYQFTIRATDSHGSFMQKNYTICAIGIDPNTLPNTVAGVAYSQTLTATSCAAAPLSWQISSGTLPTGLSLDEATGVISGIPTASEPIIVTVKLQTEAT